MMSLPSLSTTVVLLHGFPFDHSMWLSQKTLLEPSFRVITPDLRGHGQAGMGEVPFTFETYIDDAIAQLDALGIQKAVIGGLSMGGYIALRLTERAPQRVQGLILCDTRADADTNEGKWRRAQAIRTIREKGVPTFVDGFLPSLFTAETLRQRPPYVEAIRRVMLSSTPERLTCALVAMATRTDTTASLAAIQVPTLILVGEEDLITPPASSAAMAERIPGARLVTIPKASHLSNLENEPAFNTALGAFMQVFV